MMAGPSLVHQRGFVRPIRNNMKRGAPACYGRAPPGLHQAVKHRVDLDLEKLELSLEKLVFLLVLMDV